VRAEARATWWGGRGRFLWPAAGAALFLWMAVTRDHDWMRPAAPFVALCALACWGPAWLCADLLSLRFPGNPEPHREWRPVEFLARAAGRLGPFWLVLLLLAGTYCAGALAHDLAAGPPKGNLTLRPSPSSWREFPAWWSAWTAIFLVSGVPYAASAALVSAFFRHPRRWLAAPVAVVFFTLPLLAAMEFAGDGVLPDSLSSFLRDVEYYAAMPNYLLGFSANLTLQKELPTVFNGLNGALGALPALCIIAGVFFLAGAVPPVLAVWRIAARRHRRHPFTAA
jgi:hypothetical protein